MDSIYRARLIKERAILFWELSKARRSDKVRPVVSNLFITLRCNGKCNYCYTDKSISVDNELTVQQWKKVIDELYGMGCRMFNLMGGEPLLHEGFGEILTHILQKGVLCDVNTNGFLVPENIRLLQRTSQIFTSLDGDQEAHDLNRGKGAFNKTLEGIRAARKNGIPVRINCTVTRHNVEKIEYLVGLSEQYDLFLTFTPLIRVRRNLQKRAEGLKMTTTETKEAFRRIRAIKKHTSRIMNSEAALDFLINYPVEIDRIVRRDDPQELTNYYKEICPYGRLQHFVISNGDVFPCHNMWNDPGYKPMNAVRNGTAAAVHNASRLWCRYCWLANLVEWNEFTSPAWLGKGIWMTMRQLAGIRH
jgi:MoaA/NifB/PqqE/SkfB family radical SAM enzyme